MTHAMAVYDPVDDPVHSGHGHHEMLRVSERTREGFKREAERRGETIDSIASAALRALRQKEMGQRLAEPLRDDEHAWLDADLG